jgi:hypothetical protein
MSSAKPILGYPSYSAAVVAVLFPVDLLAALGPHAARRGMHPNRLARLIVAGQEPKTPAEPRPEPEAAKKRLP